MLRVCLYLYIRLVYVQNEGVISRLSSSPLVLRTRYASRTIAVELTESLFVVLEVGALFDTHGQVLGFSIDGVAYLVVG